MHCKYVRVCLKMQWYSFTSAFPYPFADRTRDRWTASYNHFWFNFHKIFTRWEVSRPLAKHIRAGEGMKQGYLDAVVYNVFLYWAEVHFDSGCLYSVVHPQLLPNTCLGVEGTTSCSILSVRRLVFFFSWKGGPATLKKNHSWSLM